MKSTFRFFLLLLLSTLLAISCGGDDQMSESSSHDDGGDAMMVSYEPNMDDPCIKCHIQATPGVVESYAKSKHNPKNVSCQACHDAQSGDPMAQSHNGFTITKAPSPNYCATCHPTEVAQNTNSKHAWTAFIGQYKPYYAEARKLGLDPLAQETAKQLDPDNMAEHLVSPLIPDSGILKKIGLLDDPDYTHNNVTLGCSHCHGTFVIVEDDGSITGLPNVGTGRVNADGSLGSCSSCHTRHIFSKEEARKPETCGQCHLGPDHPQHEIYMESKHGNIFAAMGESWDWEADDWGPDDIDAPTCATCHMSQFGPVQATHNVGDRLYWELQPKTSVPQWKGPDEVDLVLERIPDIEQAEAGRKEMMRVCTQCHSTSWAQGHFDEFDKVVSDYNMVWSYTDNLLKEAYAKGLASKDNPLDESPEIYHYLIWHHSGRRWRMGASMMGPDYTHWNGAVDTNMRYLGFMINDLEMRELIMNK